MVQEPTQIWLIAQISQSNVLTAPTSQATAACTNFGIIRTASHAQRSARW